jgi:hypothetical protein
MKSLIVLLAVFAIVNADIVFLNADAASTASSAAVLKFPQIKCGSANKEKLAACETTSGKQSEKNRVVTFNPCAENEQCARSPWVNDVEVSVKCSAVTPGSDVAVETQYPGETCTDKIKCIKHRFEASPSTATKNFECTAGKCVGYAKDTVVYEIFSCNPGFYQGDDGKCTDQIVESADCISTYSCAKGLVCLKIKESETVTKSKCTKLYTQVTGTKIEFEGKGHELVSNFVCQSGITESVTGTETVPVTTTYCADKKYDSTAHATVADNGVVNCNYTEKCKINITWGGTNSKAEATDCVVSSLSEKGVCPYARNSEKAAEKTKAINAARAENYATAVNAARRVVNNVVTDAAKNEDCLSAYENPNSLNAESCLVDPRAKVCTLYKLSGNYIAYSVILLGFLAMLF